MGWPLHIIRLTEDESVYLQDLVPLVKAIHGDDLAATRSREIFNYGTGP